MRGRTAESWSSRVVRFGLYVLCAIILILLVFPIFIVVPMSFSTATYLAFPPPSLSLHWWARFFQRWDWMASTLLSFRIGIVAMILATTLGTAASFVLVRTRFPGKNLIMALILSPIIIPTIIIAISLYFFFAEFGLVGNWIVIALGHTIICIPYVVVVVSSTLKGFDESLEHAAQSLGANRIQTFFRVTFPLIRPGVLSGAFFAFLISFDELLIAMFLAGATAGTLPKRLWDGLRFEINPTIPVAATLMMALSLSVLLIGEVVRRRGQQSRGTNVGS